LQTHIRGGVRLGEKYYATSRTYFLKGAPLDFKASRDGEEGKSGRRFKEGDLALWVYVRVTYPIWRKITAKKT